MSKLNKIRIFIRDKEGCYYRLCSVSNHKDKYGEYYLKIMFPDIGRIPLVTGHINKGKVLPSAPLNGITEFSYHYHSGIRHFKNTDGKYIDQKKKIGTLFQYPALHLLRFIIRSKSAFKPLQKSNVGKNDFVLPIELTGEPRGIEFAISRITGSWNVINIQNNQKVEDYKIPLKEQNVFLHITDCVWTLPPNIIANDVLFEFFIHDKPTSPLEFIPHM